MKLIDFRVKMYKGILDSGWVKVDQLTVLVGKNESGKTSLLRALHKLNPYSPEAYEMAKEWPRAHRKARDEKQEVCRARFQLSDQEESDLVEITEEGQIPGTVEVSRNYAGELEVHFGEDFFSSGIHSNDVNDAFNALPQIQTVFGEPFRHQADECLKETRRLAHEKRFTKLPELSQKHEPVLLDALSTSEPMRQYESDFINQYIQELTQLSQALEQLPSIESKAREYVINQLPTFIYMDDYKSFNGTAHLSDIQARQNETRLTDEDKTFLTILDLSGLNLDELVALAQGGEEQLEERQYDLADGASTLTQEISDRLHQRRYEVEYRVDGSRFFTFVKDDRDPSLIQLEERSKGFQWFFLSTSCSCVKVKEHLKDVSFFWMSQVSIFIQMLKKTYYADLSITPKEIYFSIRAIYLS